jgi:hypothetical protein
MMVLTSVMRPARSSPAPAPRHDEGFQEFAVVELGLARGQIAREEDVDELGGVGNDRWMREVVPAPRAPSSRAARARRSATRLPRGRACRLGIRASPPTDSGTAAPSARCRRRTAGSSSPRRDAARTRARHACRRAADDVLPE